MGVRAWVLEQGCPAEHDLFPADLRAALLTATGCIPGDLAADAAALPAAEDGRAAE